MEKISKLAAEESQQLKRSTKPQANGSNANLVNQIEVANFWAGMTEVFGTTWKTQYGKEPSQTWKNGLMQLTRPQLLQGKKVVMGLALKFPPNLSQFLDYCINGRPRDKQDVVRSNFNQGQLPPNYSRPALPMGEDTEKRSTGDWRAKLLGLVANPDPEELEQRQVAADIKQLERESPPGISLTEAVQAKGFLTVEDWVAAKRGPQE